MSQTIRGEQAAESGFTLFFAEKMRPVVERVAPRRRNALKWGLVVAGAVFLVFFLVVYAFFAPYNQMLGENKITYWPLLVLLPSTMAVISFSLVYIVALRALVKDFREALVGRMAEYIDPGLVFEEGQPFAADELDASLLFTGWAEASSGADRFGGRCGNARVGIAEAKAAPVDRADGRDRHGIVCNAKFEKRFRPLVVVLPRAVPASLSAMGEKLRADGDLPEGELVRLEDPGLQVQILTPSSNTDGVRLELSPDLQERLSDIRLRRGVEFSISLRGDSLWMAMLSDRDADRKQDIFDGFDFARCRDFCLDASLFMRLARELEANDALWA